MGLTQYAGDTAPVNSVSPMTTWGHDDDRKSGRTTMDDAEAR
jgi:hypothetical protein